MNTELFTKSVATKEAARLQQQHGGQWLIEQVGRRWRVVQTATRETVERDRIRRSAEAVLDSTFQRHFGIDQMREEKMILKEELAKFSEKFATNPFYALEWGTNVCQQAANYKVISEILDTGASENEVCEYWEQEAARCTEYEKLSYSSSPMSNLMAAAYRIALRKYTAKLRAAINAKARALGDLYAVEEGLI